MKGELVWLNPDTKFDLFEIIDYLELSEHKDYAESGYPKNHIWRRAKRLKEFLKRLKMKKIIRVRYEEEGGWNKSYRRVREMLNSGLELMIEYEDEDGRLNFDCASELIGEPLLLHNKIVEINEFGIKRIS